MQKEPRGKVIEAPHVTTSPLSLAFSCCISWKLLHCWQYHCYFDSHDEGFRIHVLSTEKLKLRQITLTGVFLEINPTYVWL
jgi:hypothetical protein